MRTLFLALMIALLPLRGWVGDVMAVELSTKSPAAQHGAQEPAPAVMPDCHEAHGASAHHTAQAIGGTAASQADEPASTDCGSCTVCQICHSVALTPVLPQLPPAVLPAATPASSQPLYASAERALGYKPPIF